MPLFGRSFFSKKTPPRKSSSMSMLHKDLDPMVNQAEFGLNYGHAKLKLGDKESVFDEGKWISGEDSVLSSDKEINQLRIEKQRLQEENNFLKCKVEVLLNLLAEASAELHLQDMEIEEIKNKTHPNPRNMNMKKK